MRNLIVVAFLEPVAAGMEFPREDWPLHITLVKFDVVEQPPVDGGPPGVVEQPPVDGGPPGVVDLLAARVAGLMDAAVGAALGSAVTIGAEAGFGRRGTIPVSLVEPSPALQTLHEALVAAVRSLPGRISTPDYTGTGYRPHVSHRPGKALRAGAQLALDRIALVDMAPGGGHATRRVLRLWDATS